MRMLTSAELQERVAPTEPKGSVVKILDGALRAVGALGARRLSMSDISSASGVSRGTLYKYFSSKEDVLAAVSEFVCTSFEDGIRAAGRDLDDPVERFREVMRFFARFTAERTPDHLFETEPAFYIDFFRTHFDRHKAAVRDALDPVIDAFEGLLRGTINRDIFAEMLVRMQLSSVLVPVGDEWLRCWDGAPTAIEEWLLQTMAPLVEIRRG